MENFIHKDIVVRYLPSIDRARNVEHVRQVLGADMKICFEYIEFLNETIYHAYKISREKF